MKRIQISLSKLKHGMKVADDVYALNGTLIALKNSIVDERMMTLFQRHHIKTISIQKENIQKEEEKSIKEKYLYDEFYKLQEDMEQVVDEIIGKREEIKIEEIVKQLEHLIVKEGDSFDLLKLLFTKGQESTCSYWHAIYVSVLSYLFGQWLDFSKEDRILLIMTGLFYDIGKCCIKSEILNKEGLLNKAEYEIVRQHTIKGYQLIKDKNIDNRIKEAVLSHHERCDGMGYPLGTKEDNIGQFARIIAIVDVYAAMTEKRPYRKRNFSPFEVVNYMEQDGFGKLDSNYLIIFLSHILDAYINRKVKLNNNVIGEIVFINKSNLSKPLLKTEDGYLDLSLNPDLDIVQMLS